MTRGWPLVYLVIAGLLVVGAVGMLAVRELFATWLVVLLVLTVLVAVSLLMELSRRRR